MKRLHILLLFLVACYAHANPKLVSMFNTMDVDRNDRVTKIEFRDFWLNHFHKRDTDGDGFLKADAYSETLSAIIDTNRDGRFQESEEEAFRMLHFEQMDTDKSLELSLEEMTAQRPTIKTVREPKDEKSAMSDLAQIEALAYLTALPNMWSAGRNDSTEDLQAIYFDGLDWKGKETKVFAWLGLPKDRSSNVPGIVLVHGGGGTAYKDWVQRWVDRGYAAISIAVEGQTDIPVEGATHQWESHEWAGPARVGIYGDSAEPIKDQWMYHAVANTILANSVLRSWDGVDADKVGIMGISWGGVITSTVIGLDSRFAFAIPAYGCGGLATAKNQYGRSLGNNVVYQETWDPVLRLGRVKAPTLWLSWPGDEHFPMEQLAISYGAMEVDHSLALIPGLRHGHGPPQMRPESYAFADSVTKEGAAWGRTSGHSLKGQLFEVTFQSSRKLDAATLIYTTSTSASGSREWFEAPAELNKGAGQTWTAQASLPANVTAYFINVQSGDLIASSDYQE